MGQAKAVLAGGSQTPRGKVQPREQPPEGAAARLLQGAGSWARGGIPGVSRTTPAQGRGARDPLLTPQRDFFHPGARPRGWGRFRPQPRQRSSLTPGLRSARGRPKVSPRSAQGQPEVGRRSVRGQRPAPSAAAEALAATEAGTWRGAARTPGPRPLCPCAPAPLSRATAPGL